MSDTGDQIRARFIIRSTSVTVLVLYHEVTLTLRWLRKDPEAGQHVRTLIGNLPNVVAEGLNEATVQDQVKGLDREIEELFLEEDKERPDDS